MDFRAQFKGPFNPERPSLGAESTLARVQVPGCVNNFEGTGRFWLVEGEKHGLSSVANLLGQYLEMCVLGIAGAVVFLQNVVENQDADVSPMQILAQKALLERRASLSRPQLSPLRSRGRRFLCLCKA